MFIQKFQLLNYKSYIDSGAIKFAPGINVVIGQNNSGKTAFLEALTLKLSSKPHRSIHTLPTPFTKIQKESSANIALALDKAELRDLLEQLSPPLGIPEPIDEHYSVDSPEEARHVFGLFQEWLDNLEEYVEIDLLLSSESQCGVKQAKNVLPLGNFVDQQELYFVEIGQSDDGTLFPCITSQCADDPYEGLHCKDVGWKGFKGGAEQTITYKIFDLFRNRIYRFYAERLNIGACACTGNSELNPDASNLAEVLRFLSSKNPNKFHRLNQYISIIFPQLKNVSLEEKEDSLVEIRVWTLEAAKSEREDLTLPLSECGTGISQVLAILYVILTSQFPRTIIIDEPQSFLHPGAAKKLVTILKDFPQHQYIISTHSPMVIGAASPCRIVKLTYENSQTIASVIDPNKTAEQEAILAEVGVRLADVFGADNILWVEGETEELCFPLILEEIAKRHLNGTSILAVKQTGNLEGKRSEVIFEIYDRLSGGKSLFPPAIGFVLDREGKSQKEMDDLKRRSHNHIEFLPRRMYENYLLFSDAIAFVLNADCKERESSIEVAEVEAWISHKREQREYLKGNQKQNLSDDEWIERINAAQLLTDLFNELTEAKVRFSKTRHSYAITKWLVEHKPEELTELGEFLNEILGWKIV